MEKFEEAVLDYICGRPTRFVNPQFEVPYDGIVGGSCPDFVVIDFEEQTVYVVEVSTAANVESLLARVRERESRWLQPVWSHFAKVASFITEPPWEYHVTIFVRADQLKIARRALSNEDGVSVLCVEDTVFSWSWDWNKNVPVNSLRAAGKERHVS